jgi:predicted ribosomally synthesized peptide with nif11-like leader
MKMSQNEMQKKIETLVNDAKFAEKLSQCETCDEIAALFGTEGIEVSGEELERAIAQLSVQDENGELSEDNLEQISGGSVVSSAAILIGATAKVHDLRIISGHIDYHTQIRNQHLKKVKKWFST